MIAIRVGLRRFRKATVAQRKERKRKREEEKTHTMNKSSIVAHSAAEEFGQKSILKIPLLDRRCIKVAFGRFGETTRAAYRLAPVLHDRALHNATRATMTMTTTVTKTEREGERGRTGEREQWLVQNPLGLV